MSTLPERRALLGNFDRFADGIHYGLDGGQIERLPEGRIVGVPRHGWFAERDGTFMALLRDEVSLWFVTGGERHDVQHADVARHVDGDDYELIFSREGTPIATARYHDPQPNRNRRLIAPKLDYTAKPSRSTSTGACSSSTCSASQVAATGSAHASSAERRALAGPPLVQTRPLTPRRRSARRAWPGLARRGSSGLPWGSRRRSGLRGRR